MSVTQAPHRLPRIVQRFRALRAAIRGLFLANGLAWCLLIVGGFVVVTFLLDFLLNLPVYVRLTFLAAGAGFFGYFAWRRLIRPMVVPIRDDDLALFVERQYPELDDRLISALQLSRVSGEDAFNSPELVDDLVREADDLSQALDFRRVITARAVGLIGAGALGLAFLLGGLALWKPQYASIYARRALGFNTRWPQKIRLKVLDPKDPNNQRFLEPGEKVLIARGEDLVIAVEVEKLRAGARTPSSLTLLYKFEGGEAGEKDLEPTEEGDRFHTRFDRVTGPFEFTVKGGDDETEPHRVETQTPPDIQKFRVRYQYPRYLGWPDKFDDKRHLEAPAFTTVTFWVESNTPLRSAQLVVGPKGREETRNLRIENENAMTGEIRIVEPKDEYAFKLTATNGLTNRDPLAYTMKAQIDEKPKIEILDPVIENEDISEICVRPIEFEVKDDHGVAKIEVGYQVRGEATSAWVWTTLWTGNREEKHRTSVPFRCRISLPEPKESDPSKRDPTILYVRPVAKPGDHIYVQIRASDFKDEGAVNVEVSPTTIHFSVKPLSEIDRALQEEIDRIKKLLAEQRKKQEDEYRRSRGLERKYDKVETLDEEQRGEVRTAQGEQNGIVDRLVTACTDIGRVKNRGVYNGVFDPDSAKKLDDAVDVLKGLVGDPKRRESFGAALAAVQALDEAAASRDRGARGELFRKAQDLQSESITGIQKALDLLEKWANYQEVIRMMREALDIQKRVNDWIRGLPK